MNEFVISRQDEQIQELLELLEDMQKETEQKDEVITELQRQLSESLKLNEKLNSENKAENIQALKNDLKRKNELLQNEKKKLERAESAIRKLQDSVVKAEQEKYYAETHQKTVEISVEKRVLYEKCRKCDKIAYQKAKDRYEQHKGKLDRKYQVKIAMYHMTITGFLLYFLLVMIFTAIQTEVFINDCKAFFLTIWNGIYTLAEWLIVKGKYIVQAAKWIPNERIAMIAYWIFLLLIVGGTAIGAVMIVFFCIIKWKELYQKNCLDIISVIVAAVSLAVVLYFGEWLKEFIKWNLMVILFVIQMVYVAIRWYVKGCKNVRWS